MGISAELSTAHLSGATPQTAVLADIHGNRRALEAVLRDLEAFNIDEILNLGDSLYGPLDPSGTARLLQSLDISVSVRGNQDRALLDPTTEQRESPTYRYVMSALSSFDLDWLAEHREAPVVRGECVLCHGTLERDDVYLLEVVQPIGVVLSSPVELQAMVSGVEGSLILCGHSHVPRVVALGNGKLVVNPGSVGLPAFTDSFPHPHALEAGSPHARYALVAATRGGWAVTHRSVSYDWEASARQALENGRPDWARWLRTGRAEFSEGD